MRSIRLLALLLSFGPIRVQGAFFMRLRGSERRQLQALGGQPIYRATARINGAPAEVNVFGFGSAARDVADEIRRLWQLPPLAAQGPAWLTRLRDGRTIHLLVLPGVRLSDTTVWLIEPRDRGRLPQGTAIPPPPGVNLCPAGELHGWIANDQTHSLFILYRTPEPPAAALQGAADALAAEGWQEQARTGTLSLLAREGRTALACAATGGDGSSATQLAVFLQGAAPRP